MCVLYKCSSFALPPAGVDFTGAVFEGRFEPFSSQREICTFFSVVRDGVVEVSESFSVELSINEGLLRTFGDRIHMTNLATTITIVDTSELHCKQQKLTYTCFH